MRIIAAVIAVLACACQDNSGYNLPVNPGGGGGGGSGGFADASTIDGPDGGPMFKVCLLTSDLRGLNGCAGSGAANLTVTIGSGSNAATAMTAEDGSFTITVPSGNGLYWTVTGNTIYTTVMAVGGTSIIPAVTIDEYGNFELSNSVADNPGDGGLLIKVVSSTTSTPVVGATATITPDNVYGAFYDGTSADKWNTGTGTSTGTDGTIWFPTVLPGTATVTLQPAGDSTPSTFPLPIDAQTLTMLFAVVST